MRRASQLALYALLFFACDASAQVYQCGEQPPVFQDQPCGSQGFVPAQAPGSGVRDSERAWLRQRAARPAPARRPAARSSSRAAERQAKQCWRKRAQLDEVQAKLRRGYKPAQGDRLRRQRRRYEDYLREFCR